jgi:hypothetical protein
MRGLLGGGRGPPAPSAARRRCSRSCRRGARRSSRRCQSRRHAPSTSPQVRPGSPFRRSPTRASLCKTPPSGPRQPAGAGVPRVLRRRGGRRRRRRRQGDGPGRRHAALLPGPAPRIPGPRHPRGHRGHGGRGAQAQGGKDDGQAVHLRRAGWGWGWLGGRGRGQGGRGGAVRWRGSPVGPLAGCSTNSSARHCC